MQNIDRLKDIVEKQLKCLEQQIAANKQAGVKQYLEGQRDAYLEMNDVIELLIRKEI